MPISATRVLGQAQRDFKQRFRALRTDTARQARAILLNAASVEGAIPEGQLAAVQERVGRLVSAELVRGRQAFADDGMTALTPYAEILNRGIAQVTIGVVRAHHDWLRRTAPEDVFRWLASNSRVVSEQFTPNPLATYDRAHTFVDPNGYRLSDRIWLVNSRARVAVDQFLAVHIRNGDSAVRMAAELEQWLIPGRAQIRTQRPYGRDGSFDAMRLARTEITAAHGRATLAAARSNPYVESIDWVLSPSHPRADICDPLAAGSPYRLQDVPIYPPHPHCLCVLVSNTRRIAEVTEELREMMDAGQPPPYVTPANDFAFLVALLGPLVLQYIGEFGRAA